MNNGTKATEGRTPAPTIGTSPTPSLHINAEDSGTAEYSTTKSTSSAPQKETSPPTLNVGSSSGSASVTSVGGAGHVSVGGSLQAVASDSAANHHHPMLVAPHAVHCHGSEAECPNHLEIASEKPHLADVAMKLLRLHELYDSQNLLRPGRALWASVKKMVIDEEIKMKLKRELSINIDEVMAKGK